MDSLEVVWIVSCSLATLIFYLDDANLIAFSVNHVCLFVFKKEVQDRCSLKYLVFDD